MSVRIPPAAWNPIVSAGATGTEGAESKAWLKLNAEYRLFCAELSGVSEGMPHSFCMKDKMDTLVVCWPNTPRRAYGLTMIIGVRAPYPALAGGATWSQNPPLSS